MTELHVVTLLASATEIVCAFGDGDRHRGYRFMCLTGLMVLSGIGTAFGPPPRR